MLSSPLILYTNLLLRVSAPHPYIQHCNKTETFVISVTLIPPFRHRTIKRKEAIAAHSRRERGRESEPVLMSRETNLSDMMKKLRCYISGPCNEPFQEPSSRNCSACERRFAKLNTDSLRTVADIDFCLVRTTAIR